MVGDVGNSGFAGYWVCILVRAAMGALFFFIKTFFNALEMK